MRFRREDITAIIRYHEYKPKSFNPERPDPLCPICGRSIGHSIILLARFRGEQIFEIHAECPKGKPDYFELADNEIEELTRRIVRNSESDEEIQQRLEDELGYPYGAAIHSHLPTDAVGREARAIVLGLGGLIRKDGAMVMIMMHGPRGNTISI